MKFCKESAHASFFSFSKGRLKHMEDEVWRSRPDQEEDAQICPNCGYTYIIAVADRAKRERI